MTSLFSRVLARQPTQERYAELRDSSPPADNDAEAPPVEDEPVTGISTRLMSGAPEEELQEKQFLEKPGIPIPPLPRFRLTLCLRWLVLVSLLLGLLQALGRWMTEQAMYDIHSVKNLDLDIDNCNVELQPMPASLSHGAVTIQYWKFMRQIHHVSQHDGTMHLQLDMRVKIPMFRCLVSIFAPSLHLDRLTGHMGGSEQCSLQMDEAIAKDVNLTSQQVIIRARAMPEKLSLQSSLGIVAVWPRSLPDTWEANIQADHANVLVEVPGTFSLDLAGHGKKNSVLCADSIEENGADKYLMQHGSGGSMGKVRFEAVKEAAGYIKAGDDWDTDLKVLRGSAHEEPSLFNKSMEDLNELADWIHTRTESMAPWVARIHLNGPNLPKGAWEMLSSEAFLTVPLQWYVLLSGGTLRPKVREVHLHPMGLNAWPAGEQNATKLRKGKVDKIVMDEFEMLKPYILKAGAPGATVAWVPHEGRPLVFSKTTNKWSASELSYAQVNVMMLLIAVSFNLVVSVLVAGFVIMWLQANADFQQELKDEAVTTASSHRVGKLHGKTNSSWRIIAAHVEQPDQGVILRWRKRTGVQSSAFLCVKAKADPDPARGLEGDEICIDMAVQERVDLKSESNIIIEFFFSASGSKGYPPEGGYEPTGKDLKCQYSYRFQVEGYNQHQELVAVSDWSNEVYIKPRSTIFDVPARILKANFAVPTDSLEYFVEHFAQFNIDGRHPQHLVVLSDIKVCYHKNWRDYRDCMSAFCLTAYMGESSAKCQKDTVSGTCKNYDKTGIFIPPPDIVSGEVEEDEDARTQELNEVVTGGNQSLCVGAADRKLCDVFVTLQKASGEDVAEGQLEWDDLLDAFDKFESEGESQTIFVELATDKAGEGEFDEEWLVWVEARVTFKNELDPKCEEMPFHRRVFQLDAPGQIFYEGMERFLPWEPTSETLAEMSFFDIYMIYPELDLEPLLLAEHVSITNGGVSVMINFPEGVTGNHVVCQLAIEGFNEEGEQTYARSSMEEEPLDGKSHRFIVCRTWTLAHFELMYASFCRMNCMEMERVTEDVLKDYGMVVAREQLKVVSGLRKSLIFEEIGEQEIIDCPGLIMVSDKNIVAKPSMGPDMDWTAGASDAGGSVLRTISSGKTPLLSSAMSTSSPKGRGSAGPVIERREYRSTFQSVGFLENAWPRYPHCLDMAYGTGWMPSFLLLNSFYPVDNILNAIKAGADWFQLPVAYQTIQAIGGRTFAEKLLQLLTAPLYGVVPYLCEAFLYLLQLCSFLMLPFLLLLFGMCYELVGMYFAINPEAYSFETHTASYIPDMTFSAVVSGHSLEDWFMGLSSVSFVSLVGSFNTALVMVLLICESNFLRNLPPPSIQHAVHQVLNGMGGMLVSSYVWVILSFSISSVLWFAMVVVIYPEQMLTALACAGGFFALFATMINGLNNTKDELERSLREEIPEVLELVCDTFLDQYDKTSSGRGKAVINQYRKLEEELAEKTAEYVKGRLKGVSKLQDVVGSAKAPKEVLGSLFNRALVKSRGWPAISEQEAGKETKDDKGVETTDSVLESLGLPQEDTTVMPYLDLRMRLEDKEREEGGENIHNYGSDLQEKLMKVYVRMQEVHMEMPPDVGEALRNPKRLAKCMHRANLAKYKTLERGSEKDAKSSLQICIQDLNQQQVENLDLYMVEHLDETLSQVDISEMVTPFVETTIPAEVSKQVRFALDETRQDSSAQQLFDLLRRKKNSMPRKQVRQKLTLNRVDEPEGLMGFLVEIGVIEKTAARRKASHHLSLYRRVERHVHMWKREDEEGHETKDLIVDPSDLEEFVRDLVHHQIWWGAMESILKSIGFPIGEGENQLSRELVLREYELTASKDGFLPRDKMLDFLRKVSCAGVADGAAGRLWKAQMVMLFQHLNICGFVGKAVAPRKNKKAAAEEVDIADDGLREMAKQTWPAWMEKAWTKVAPAVASDNLSKPFLPRTLIYKFVKEVAHSRETSIRSYKETGNIANLKIIDEEYDSWKKEEVDGSKYIWVNRGKGLLRVRGIWLECFLDILKKMGSPVQDMKEGLFLFDQALQDQTKELGSRRIAEEEIEGLLSADYLQQWMHKNLVERTTEVSLTTFKEALKMAEFTLPFSSVEALWYSADKAVISGGKERASLRQVRDLEDRLVMYLTNGMFYESVRNLIVNELHVPSLQSLDAKEIQAAFKQVDEKTGYCGIIDPHEVSELLRLLSQEGMDLPVVQQSFEQLKLHLDQDAVQDNFMMVDTNCDDKIDLTEFLSLIDRLVDTILPDAIFDYMGLQRHQIFRNVMLKVITILTMFLFVFVSLNAFHVDVGEKAASAGSSTIRAALAGLALLGLRNDNSPEYLEKQYTIAKEQLYRITGVSRSQLEARRRTGALGAGAAGAGFGKRFARRGGGGGGMLGKEDEDDDGGDMD